MAVPTRPVGGASIESAWGGVVHDAAVAQDIQTGVATVPTTVAARNELVVVFPRPFAAPPAVFVTALGFQTTVAGLTNAAATTATQTTLAVFPNAGGSNAVGSIQVNWLAIGPRA